jgi:hypothetical protein
MQTDQTLGGVHAAGVLLSATGRMLFRMKFKVTDCDLKHLPSKLILMWSQFATTSRMAAEDRTDAVTNCDRITLGSWKLCA